MKAGEDLTGTMQLMQLVSNEPLDQQECNCLTEDAAAGTDALLEHQNLKLYNALKEK